MLYKAHINEKTQKIQTVKEHSLNTALKCREFSIPILKEILYMIGLLHDIGKYQISFQERINGRNIKVEHSGCGAQIAVKEYSGIVGYLMAYCIAGHHSGIPDGGCSKDTPDMSTLSGRIKRSFDDYSRYIDELDILTVDEKEFCSFLIEDCGDNKEYLIEKFAFLTRYCFSCLTDADSLDTAFFCTEKLNRSLHSNFERCLIKVNNFIETFSAVSNIQKTRQILQNQVYQQIDKDADIYLLNMPTGSGKTLCSIKFALQRAILKNKKRIIYVIPYNSIIEQTADIFENIMGDDAQLLRHQSTFSYDDEKEYSEDYRETAQYATENWDAGLIITTAVQFFETVYSNKRSKLRKMHNMSDSILIFDEAHLMPIKYLQPCLQAISFITKYLGSETVLMTATMPNYGKLLSEYTITKNKISNLVIDTSLFSVFNKCKYLYMDSLSEEKLLSESIKNPSSLIVVNKRSTARKLYSLCRGKVFHLSTYMTAFDRSNVIETIRIELKKLECDFPDLDYVPDDRKITVISTSLIEAGVDLDFYAVFRELAGLDNILQAGGRCNREGKRKIANVYVFTLETDKQNLSSDERPNITKGLFQEYDDISCQKCIDTYYERLYFVHQEDIVKKTISRDCNSPYRIPFNEYAQSFHMIDTDTVSIVVARDEISTELIEKLRILKKGNPRKFQKYSLTIYKYEFDDLLKQHVIDDFESGIYCLTNSDYYDENTGIQFEGKDYII